MHGQTKGANLWSCRINAATLQKTRAGLIYGTRDEYGIQMANVTAGQS